MVQSIVLRVTFSALLLLSLAGCYGEETNANEAEGGRTSATDINDCGLLDRAVIKSVTGQSVREGEFRFGVCSWYTLADDPASGKLVAQAKLGTGKYICISNYEIMQQPRDIDGLGEKAYSGFAVGNWNAAACLDDGRAVYIYVRRAGETGRTHAEALLREAASRL